MESKEEIDKGLNNDYPLIPMGEITDEARKIAVMWGDEYFPGIAIMEKHKLASDIMNYARRFHERQKEERIRELEDRLFKKMAEPHADKLKIEHLEAENKRLKELVNEAESRIVFSPGRCYCAKKNEISGVVFCDGNCR